MEVHYLHFDEIDSTNTWAKAHFGELPQSALTCITAGRQTAGHGRYGKSWSSKKGNLHLTLAFSLPSNSPMVPHLAQLLSFSFWQCLEKEGVVAQFKWPNDLLIDGKKICGVLAETVALPKEEIVGIALGIGANINTPIATDQETTSLFEVTGHRFHLDELGNQLVERFGGNLKLLAQQGFSPFKAAIEAVLAFKGEKVSFQRGGDKLTGLLIGLNEQGEVVIQGENGTTRSFSSGEIAHLRCCF